MTFCPTGKNRKCGQQTSFATRQRLHKEPIYQAGVDRFSLIDYSVVSLSAHVVRTFTKANLTYPLWFLLAKCTDLVLLMLETMLFNSGCTHHNVVLQQQLLPARTGPRLTGEIALIIDDALTNATANTVMRHYQLGRALAQYAEHATSNCFQRVVVYPSLESVHTGEDTIAWPKLLTMKEQEPARFDVVRISDRVMVLEVEWQFLNQGHEKFATKRVGSRVTGYAPTTAGISAAAFRELTLKTYDAFASIPEFAILKR